MVYSTSFFFSFFLLAKKEHSDVACTLSRRETLLTLLVTSGDHGQSRGNSKHALARGPIGPYIHTKDPSRWHSCSRKMMPLCADILISYINGVHVR